PCRIDSVLDLTEGGQSRRRSFVTGIDQVLPDRPLDTQHRRRRDALKRLSKHVCVEAQAGLPNGIDATRQHEQPDRAMFDLAHAGSHGLVVRAQSQDLEVVTRYACQFRTDGNLITGENLWSVRGGTTWKSHDEAKVNLTIL